MELRINDTDVVVDGLQGGRLWRGATLDGRLGGSAPVWKRRPDHRGLMVVQRGRVSESTVSATCGPFGVEVMAEPPAAVGIAWAALLPSVAAGVVMSFVFSPLMAVLAAVSVVVMVGRSVGSRIVRRRRLVARAKQQTAYDLAAAVGLDEWIVVERTRLWDAVLTSSALLEFVEHGGFSPWRERGAERITLLVGKGSETRELEIVPEPHVQVVELVDMPVVVTLERGCGIALSGDREPSLRSARWLLTSLAARYGPADLGTLLITTPDRLVDWDWLKWLPARPQICVTLDEAETALARVSPESPVLAVIDGVEPSGAGRFAEVLSGRSESTRLMWLGLAHEAPAGCAAVVELAPDGWFQLDRVGEGPRCGVASGLTASDALAAALWLAPLDDPESHDSTVLLPATSALGDLFEVSCADDWPSVIAARWARSHRGALLAPIGVDHSGAVEVDLVADGPHALVAGTTGSGKSEFLRTLVAGIATSHPPSHVSFVLIDFKGGGALDVVADLPHVAAVVTDLDRHESERALRSLRAELLDREKTLREAGVSDISDLTVAVSLSRMVVVVDEFAALADELPRFLDGLVDIARRGRSLGVHLVLATQRPAGVVTGQIRANTSLRVCLRVQDQADSFDVIDCGGGAQLPPIAGRALVMRNGTLSEIQIARVGHSEGGMSIRPFVLHPSLLTDADRDSGETVVDAAAIVAATRGLSAGTNAATPWAPLLAERPDWREASDRLGDGFVGLGWLDDPDQRRHEPVGWRPSDGGLLVIGSETARLEKTIELAITGLAVTCPQLSVYVVDGGLGNLGTLQELPSVGDVIDSGDTERVARLLTLFGTKRPTDQTVLVLHRYAAIVDQLSAAVGPDAAVAMQRLVRDGSSSGLRFIVTGGSDREVSVRVASLFSQRLIHPLADPNGYLAFNIRGADCGGLGPNDIIEPGTGRRGRISWLTESERLEIVSALPGRSKPDPIRVLGARVVVDELPIATPGPSGWIVPLGLDEELEARSVVLSPSRPIIVVGQPESGRTTALATATASLERSSVCLIDDADQVDRAAAEQLLAAAAAAGKPVLIATTPASLRGFSSWITPLLATASVVLLNPTRQDGEAVRALVPDLSNHPVGRSVLIDRGRVSILQLAA